MRFQKTFSFGTETAQVSIDFTTLPANAQEFIIRYGLTQYLSDGAAIAKDEYPTEAERNTAKAEGVLSRVAKLREGTMSIRGGGTRTVDPVAKVKREVALEILKAHAKANDIKLPKGEELSAKIEKFWQSEKNTKALMPEVEKRLKAMEKTADKLGELDI